MSEEELPPYRLFKSAHRREAIEAALTGLEPGVPVPLPERAVFSTSAAVASRMYGPRRVKIRRWEGRLWACLLREGDK